MRLLDLSFFRIFPQLLDAEITHSNFLDLVIHPPSSVSGTPTQLFYSVPLCPSPIDKASSRGFTGEIQVEIAGLISGSASGANVVLATRRADVCGSSS